MEHKPPAAIDEPLSVWIVLRASWQLCIFAIFVPVLCPAAFGPVLPLALAAPPHNLSVDTFALVMSCFTAIMIVTAALNERIVKLIGGPFNQVVIGLTIQASGLVICGISDLLLPMLWPASRTIVTLLGVFLFFNAASFILMGATALILARLDAQGLRSHAAR